MTNPFEGAADDAIQAGGDLVDEKTGGRFEEQVDQGQEAVAERLGGGGEFGDSGGDIEGGGGSGDSGGDIEGGGGSGDGSGGDIESDPDN